MAPVWQLTMCPCLYLFVSVCTCLYLFVFVEVLNSIETAGAEVMTFAKNTFPKTQLIRRKEQELAKGNVNNKSIVFINQFKSIIN